MNVNHFDDEGLRLIRGVMDLKAPLNKASGLTIGICISRDAGSLANGSSAYSGSTRLPSGE